ncbi:MAG: family 43 glycosylhydrolase [Bacteroidales bacterium]|nr:family 43 glycosylhydrolase [Bacteroidales bacterium]
MLKYLSLLLVILATQSTLLRAQNPIIQTYYTADPAPMVYNGRVYLYTTHDEDETVDNFFTMYDWRCYSTADMVNWTDHGAVASLKDFKWSERTNGAWAPQCIERNGKFYLYCPIHGDGIGVLVADSPEGPFIDPIGKRLIESDNIWLDIDPTVIIDDDGQAYLFWGNPALKYAKLNEDMISCDMSLGDNGVKSVEMTHEGFGTKEGRDGEIVTTYTEGPWVYKDNDIYYLVYAAAGIPEYIAYSTSSSIEGPWEYKGFIMERADQLAFTNHPGIIDFKENSYFFYHSQGLPGGEGFRRSVCVEQFSYNADGSIPLLHPTKDGVKKGVAYLNPYRKVEAETIAWSEGVKTYSSRLTGMYLTAKHNDAFTKVRDVDFREKGSGSFTAQLATSLTGGVSMEVRLDSLTGKLIGTVDVPQTGSDEEWALTTIDVEKITGIHDLYFVFKGTVSGDILNFDYWSFSE